ncbi:hypothetical protein SB775_02345 [Peribacillus sp. SIMBA_075]|uniref:hypothetical protein n=1 Tax=Peribacillus sp. SIMBA_075 TaxID=3085813 RepID=UPI00397ADC22
MIPMAIALGYDAMTGYAMVYLGAMAGFLTGITNPYNVGVAQGIAELALFLWMGLPGILPPALNAIGLFFVQLSLNFLVPSGSGQAALTMPIVRSVGDMVGLTRQTTVLAFRMEDVVSNITLPTGGLLLGVLTIAGIPYVTWIRWVFPYFLLIVSVGVIFLIIAQLINYGPF